MACRFDLVPNAAAVKSSRRRGPDAVAAAPLWLPLAYVWRARTDAYRYSIEELESLLD
jgi:hypothetical protein